MCTWQTQTRVQVVIDDRDDLDRAGDEVPVDERYQSACEDRDRYLDLARRTQADLENLRRRASRDVAAAEDRGVAKALGEVLGAADSLDRALASADPEDDHPAWEGMRAVHGQLHAALGRLGIEAFSPDGQGFDPTEMEALATRPDTSAQQGIVVEVYQAGYRRSGQVLRPARVVVAA